MANMDTGLSLRSYFPFGFQLSRKAWEQYDVLDLVDDGEDISVVDDIYRLRQLALRVNQQRLRSTYTLDTIHAGQLVTVALIQDILRYVTERYCHEQQPGVVSQGLQVARQHHGAAIVDQPVPAFVRFFPPQTVMKDKFTNGDFLACQVPVAGDKEASSREIVTTEMILLWHAAINPAYRNFRELFDDAQLKQNAPYAPFVESMEQYFAGQPPLDEIGATLFEVLRAPMKASPDSLEGQLEFMKEHWTALLPEFLTERVAIAVNILREEEMSRGFGPPELKVLEFGPGTPAQGDHPEPDAFTKDADWMSNVVLLAKSTYVWLDQLSKKYQRDVHTLADIPDEELDRLARWGFSGLWLIGLWERSPASQKIKQWTGNPEAVASAYSLYDYVIAADLGGEEAYQNLRARAWQRGIRLASDMVPNHVGIFSKWVIEHPDWFVQSPHPPFPVYNFTGGNLSDDERVELYVEDGYWSRSDAAVVFKHVDAHTGDIRYIYHGNDGTNMPWNDTAQLNFLLDEVREAVVQTILHVARKFPIIRFDAAMTLAKRHFQRLWFPKPGEGGAIPSRAEHGMTQQQFDEVFPKEFWREVVDRVQAEQPDTLLLAEAFWLMEGYFVRTLGMHRVYNSAFMNMLKMEDNEKYRQTVKNVLEFSPEVLMRFVNFMNNPDEDTAVAQFGDGDKYIGVAVLMVTMPGLPMFGHGQVEGFTEKYGMEYRRAYWDETPNERLVWRHAHEVFPLMRRRGLFSGAENFALFDFVTDEGHIDENVFAYSNRANGERALILFNNACSNTAGRIHMSTAINTGTSDAPHLVRLTLGEALALPVDDEILFAFRDHRTGLHYLQQGKRLAEEGLYVQLGGYQYQAFVDFREIRDGDGSWTRLAAKLSGHGVPDLQEAYRELQLEPLLGPWRALYNGDSLRALIGGAPQAMTRFEQALAAFLVAAQTQARAEGGTENMAGEITAGVRTVLDLATALEAAKVQPATAKCLLAALDREAQPLTPALIAWLVTRPLGRLRGPWEVALAAILSRNRLTDWLLGKVVSDALQDYRQDAAQGAADARLVDLLVAHETLLGESTTPLAAVVERAFADAATRAHLEFNNHNGDTYVNKERLERWIDALLLAHVIACATDGSLTAAGATDAHDRADRLIAAAATAGYVVEKMLKLL